MKRASLPADVPQTRCYMAACCQIDECASKGRLKLKNGEASVCKTLENTQAGPGSSQLVEIFLGKPEQLFWVSFDH